MWIAQSSCFLHRESVGWAQEERRKERITWVKSCSHCLERCSALPTHRSQRSLKQVFLTMYTHKHTHTRMEDCTHVHGAHKNTRKEEYRRWKAHKHAPTRISQIGQVKLHRWWQPHILHVGSVPIPQQRCMLLPYNTLTSIPYIHIVTSKALKNSTHHLTSTPPTSETTLTSQRGAEEVHNVKCK